ncbi:MULTISPECIES: hypothetical protein [Sphingobacterium]|uniref:hypothetical protein n=1 Tax=Sphingobacterium TaxID=28453 RepID=UPI0025914EAD|nr:MULTISPECIES: hypothetical protein [Sphingobacterium]
MCELLTKWGASEWAGIIQAGGAIISSIFLFYTFNSQKESAEIEKKSKRAEHLPEFYGTVNTKYPLKDNGSGGYFARPFNGEDTIIFVKIEFKKNPIQLNDYYFEDPKNKIVKSIDKSLFESKRIFLPGEFIEVKYTVNFRSYFEVEDNFSNYEEINLMNGVSPNYRNEIKLESMLYFSDILGNKYELSFCIHDLVKVEITKLKMID